MNFRFLLLLLLAFLVCASVQAKGRSRHSGRSSHTFLRPRSRHRSIGRGSFWSHGSLPSHYRSEGHLYKIPIPTHHETYHPKPQSSGYKGNDYPSISQAFNYPKKSLARPDYSSTVLNQIFGKNRNTDVKSSSYFPLRPNKQNQKAQTFSVPYPNLRISNKPFHRTNVNASQPVPITNTPSYPSHPNVVNPVLKIPRLEDSKSIFQNDFNRFIKKWFD